MAQHTKKTQGERKNISTSVSLPQEMYYTSFVTYSELKLLGLLRRKGQSEILMKGQTVFMHSNSSDK